VANRSKALAEVEAAIEEIRQRFSEGASGPLMDAIDETVAQLTVHLEGVDEKFGDLLRLLEPGEESHAASRVETLIASATLEVGIEQMEEAVAGLKETLAEYDEDPEIARLYEVLMKRIGVSRRSITSVEKALIAFRNRLMAYGLAHRGQGEA